MLYNLDNLHWQEFERLAASYLKEKIGEGLWIFDGSSDQGRDATFRGTANEYPSRANPYSGDWIFQVKHRSTRRKTISQVENKLLTTLDKELEKIFVKHNFCCDNYVYVTSINVSNDFRPRAQNTFDEFCALHNLHGKRFGVIEYKDLEDYITKNPAVRYSFPSLLSFTDLEKAFLKRQDVKNKGRIKFAKANIDRFVSTHHYIEATRRIYENNLLMLVGNPKTGKTSIIEALALCFLQEGRFTPYFIRNTEEFFDYVAYLPEDEGALFICDDIFGIHELDEGRYADWADYFTTVVGSIDSNHKFLFTTREYIYREFQRKSGLKAFFPDVDDPTRYVIEISELASEEREQILEKHLFTSNLSPQAIELVVQAKQEILACKDFSPEVIRSLVSLVAQRQLSQIPDVISKHISAPSQYLYDFFNSINAQKRLLLLSVTVSPTNEANDVEGTFLILLDDTQNQPEIVFQTFVDEIDGSIIKRREYLESSELEYYHPTMGDVIIEICKRDKYYRNLMLKNVNLELLYLLTILQPGNKTFKIQVQLDEFKELTKGIERLLMRTKRLPEIVRAITWTANVNNVEVSHNMTFFAPLSQMKGHIRTLVTQRAFFDAHASEPVEYWIEFFDRWNLVGGADQIQYLDLIEEHYREYKSYDYWRLMFLLENASPGYINKRIPRHILEQFVNTMIERVRGLRLGLNRTAEGKLKTEEEWLPLFREVEELINRMRKSGAGKQLIEKYLVVDWDSVKKFSETAKNRHAGMVKSGYWRKYRRLRNYKAIDMN